MNTENRCKCCGTAAISEHRAQLAGVCAMCDQCDKCHGDTLQARLVQAAATGQIDPSMGLARMMIDDANLCGRLVYVGDWNAATIEIRNPPERWEVVIARSLARNEMPDVHSVVDAVLRRRLPAPYGEQLLEDLARDLKLALSVIIPDIVDVKVQSERDIVDPEHLKILIQGKAPVLGVQLAAVAGADVEIPADIMSRPRGSA